MPSPYKTERSALSNALAPFERAIIYEALRQHAGSRQETAAALGINRTTLFNKMRRYALFDVDERSPPLDAAIPPETPQAPYLDAPSSLPGALAAFERMLYEEVLRRAPSRLRAAIVADVTDAELAEALERHGISTPAPGPPEHPLYPTVRSLVDGFFQRKPLEGRT